MISKRAIAALEEGIKNDNTVAELEYLGVTLRVINQIEEFTGIIYLKELVALSDKEVLEIPNLGEKGLASIKTAFENYHELEDNRKRWYMGSVRLEYYKKNSKRLEGALS